MYRGEIGCIISLCMMIYQKLGSIAVVDELIFMRFLPSVPCFNSIPLDMQRAGVSKNISTVGILS